MKINNYPLTNGKTLSILDMRNEVHHNQELNFAIYALLKTKPTVYILKDEIRIGNMRNNFIVIYDKLNELLEIAKTHKFNIINKS
jgi:hypothetical protein